MWIGQFFTRNWIGRVPGSQGIIILRKNGKYTKNSPKKFDLGFELAWHMIWPFWPLFDNKIHQTQSTCGHKTNFSPIGQTIWHMVESLFKMLGVRACGIKLAIGIDHWNHFVFLSSSWVLEHVQRNFWPFVNSSGNLLHDSHASN